MYLSIFGDWSYDVARNLSLSVTKKFQEEPCVSICVVLFIHDFAGFKSKNISDRVCFNLSPKLPCRDQCNWQFPQTVAWLVFPWDKGLVVPFSSSLVGPALGISRQGRCEQTGKSPTEGHQDDWGKLRKMGSFSLEKGRLRGRTISSQKHKAKGPKQPL